MEEQAKGSLDSDLFFGLPNEIWSSILEDCYFDNDVLECEDIYCALTCLKEKFPHISKNVRLVCKAFSDLFKDDVFKLKIKKFYKQLLIEKYLELRDGGFYPKGGCTWGSELETNKTIGLFLAGKGESGDILAKIIDLPTFKHELGLYEDIISVLLFYGASPDFVDEQGDTALHKIFGSPDVEGMVNIIKMLLDHDADVQTQNNNGQTIIALAAQNHNIDANIQKILIDYKLGFYFEQKLTSDSTQGSKSEKDEPSRNSQFGGCNIS